MYFIIQTVLLGTTSILCQFLFPWWIVAPCAFIVSFFVPVKGVKSFLGGFSSISFIWMLYAAMIDSRCKSIISMKIAPIFGLNSSITLIVLTGFIGGIVAGCAAYTGSVFRMYLDSYKKSSSEFGYLSNN